MASSIPRPLPIGTSPRGLPVWDGNLNRAFRLAHGIPEGEVARALSMGTAAVTALFEYPRKPVVQRYDRMEWYFDAVVRMHALREAKAAESLALLKAQAAPRDDGGSGS